MARIGRRAGRRWLGGGSAVRRCCVPLAASARELDDLVAGWTRARTPEEATSRLQSDGVAAMPVMNIADQFADPHLNARETYVEIDHPHVGAEMLYGVPWLFSGTPGNVRTPAPLLGQHNEYVLTELLGLDDATVCRLSDEQVVY